MSADEAAAAANHDFSCAHNFKSSVLRSAQSSHVARNFKRILPTCTVARRET